MYVLKSNYSVPVVSFKTNLKVSGTSKTVPNLAMSVADILSRFTRNLASDIKIMEEVYGDQPGYDLERIARMDFDDKAAFAAELKQRAERLKAEIEAMERTLESEKAERKAKERDAMFEELRKKFPGIESLDNTMPVDTGVPSSPGVKRNAAQKGGDHGA